VVVFIASNLGRDRSAAISRTQDFAVRLKR